MGTTIGGVLGLLLALYGVADLIVRVCYWLLFARGSRQRMALWVNESDAEYQIRRLAMWRHIIPDGGYEWMVVLPNSQPHMKQLCTELGLSACLEKEWVHMCKNPLQSARDGV